MGMGTKYSLYQRYSIATWFLTPALIVVFLVLSASQRAEALPAFAPPLLPPGLGQTLRFDAALIAVWDSCFLGLPIPLRPMPNHAPPSLVCN